MDMRRCAAKKKVIVEEESDYQAWLQQQKTFADLSGRPKTAKATQQSGVNEDDA